MSRLTVEQTEGGKVRVEGLEPDDGEIRHDFEGHGSFNLSTLADNGHRFAGWAVDGEFAGLDHVLHLSFEGDKTVKAAFDPEKPEAEGALTSESVEHNTDTEVEEAE